MMVPPHADSSASSPIAPRCCGGGGDGFTAAPEREQTLGRRPLLQRPPGASEATADLIAKLREARERSERLRADAARLSASLALSAAGAGSAKCQEVRPPSPEATASAASTPASASATAAAQKWTPPQSPPRRCGRQLGGQPLACPAPGGGGGGGGGAHASISAAAPSGAAAGAASAPTVKSAVLASGGEGHSRQHHGWPRCWVRIRLGTLDVRLAGGGSGAPGLLETSGFRVTLQLGADTPARWMQGAPSTQRHGLKYSRVVSGDGQYSTRVCCEFDEEIDVPWSRDQQHTTPGQLSADIWLEKRTVAERLDSILDHVGLGCDLPEFDRTWLGRAVCLLPEEGEDTVPQPWPVIADVNSNGPLPMTLTVGVEWICDEATETSTSSGEEAAAIGAAVVTSCPSGLLKEDEGTESVQIDKADGPCTASGRLHAPLICGLWGRPSLCCYG